MYWLKTVSVKDHFCAPDVTVELMDDGATEPVHLVFTGPNGSGKTTVLQGLSRFMSSSALVRFYGQGVRPLDPAIDNWVDVRWLTNPSYQARQDHQLIVATLLSDRELQMGEPSGPTVETFGPSWANESLSAKFLQYLVNQQVQARLAEADEKEATEKIFAWFRNFERELAELFEAPTLKLTFRRKTYTMVFEEDGREYTFAQLPSGYASVIHILAELILRIDALELARDAPSGVVIIDEIDAFLHPSLQEKIMPFLTGMFPNLQFVIATHSPAVATSMRRAKVVSLGTGKVYDAADLVGTPYGELLTTLFGIATDVDLATTRELAHLKELTNKRRSPEEEEEYRRLAFALERTNNPVALEAVTELLMREL